MLHLLEKGHSICVVLEYCEHGLQKASLDGQQLQHLRYDVEHKAFQKNVLNVFDPASPIAYRHLMVIPVMNIYECFNDLHHELAKPFPSTTFLQLDLVAVEDIVIKVHVIPVMKN